MRKQNRPAGATVGGNGTGSGGAVNSVADILPRYAEKLKRLPTGKLLQRRERLDAVMRKTDNDDQWVAAFSLLVGNLRHIICSRLAGRIAGAEAGWLDGGAAMKTFTVSVSRLAKGKDGYKHNKYRFGWSFYPETHTAESLIKLAAVEGYSFLAGEFDRKPPNHYGRTDVTTARITENFRQTHIIPLDDDGEAGNPVDFWQNDLLFKTYGAGYYHSTSSTADSPRIRPIFELDEPITDARLYQTARYAFGWYYNRRVHRIDVLPQIPQVWYGSLIPTEYRIFGNILPLTALVDVVVVPYLKLKRVRELRQQQQPKPAYTGSNIDELIKWLGRQNHNRHNRLLALGQRAGEAGVTWADVGGAVVAACRQNGYFDAYAGSDKEIQRVFNYGWSRA